jgi:hypothetical protein
VAGRDSRERLQKYGTPQFGFQALAWLSFRATLRTIRKQEAHSPQAGRLEAVSVFLQTFGGPKVCEKTWLPLVK